MKIPTIESRASNISMDKGNYVCCHNGSTYKDLRRILMTHKYRGSIVVLSISKSVETQRGAEGNDKQFSVRFSVSTEIIGNRKFYDRVIHNGNK